MKKLLMVLAAVTIIIALSACGANQDAAGGSDTASSGSGAATELNITAKNFEFDKTEYKVKKDEPVKLVFHSEEGVHAMGISDFNVNLKDGESKEVTFDKAGTYDIFCTFPCGAGHVNMKAKLVVE